MPFQIGGHGRPRQEGGIIVKTRGGEEASQGLMWAEIIQIGVIDSTEVLRRE